MNKDDIEQLRAHVSDLLQEHSRFSLNVSDHQYPILKKALIDIKRIVNERNLAGKVHVTRVEESEGQLFLHVRCDQVDVASQLEIRDIDHHAHWQSDHAALAANKEDHDDA